LICVVFSLFPHRKDAWGAKDIVFLIIIIIIIQTRLPRRLVLPPLEKKRSPSLEEEDAFFTAKRFSGTKYIRKQRGDDHQNHF
jgi:hypothetical protein